MCWSSTSKPELKVAEDNIPVTKIVTTIFNGENKCILYAFFHVFYWDSIFH